jgi:pantoate kinase
MRKPITSHIAPTLPAKPPRPAAPKAVPGKKTGQSKLGHGIQGLSQALEIHKQIADVAINSQNLTPGAAVAAHVVEQHTGLGNIASASMGGGLKRKRGSK